MLRIVFLGLAAWLMFAAWVQAELARPLPSRFARAAAPWAEALPAIGWALLIALLALTTALWLWSEILLARIDRLLRRRRTLKHA